MAKYQFVVEVYLSELRQFGFDESIFYLDEKSYSVAIPKLIATMIEIDK